MIHLSLRKKWIHNLKLRNKILLSYSLLILLTLGIFTTYSSYKFKQSQLEQITYSAKQAFYQSKSFIEYKLSNISYLSEVILQNEDINKMLQLNDDPDSLVTQMSNYSTMLKFIGSIQNNKNNSKAKIKIFTKKNYVYSMDKATFFAMSDVMNSLWYRELQANNGQLTWCPPDFFDSNLNSDMRQLSAVRYLRNSQDYHDIIGIIRVDFPEEEINKIVKQASTTPNSIVSIVNHEGLVVTLSSDATESKLLLQSSFIQRLANSSNHWETIKVEGRKLMLGAQLLEGTDWTLVSATPYLDIVAAASKTPKDLVFFMFALAFTAYVLAYFLSGSITQRIRQLIKNMKLIQTGILESSMKIDGKDEINELIGSFNFMVNRIKELVDVQFQTGQELKNAELRVLQAQINPHFLYNTLDLIRWTALENGDTQVPQIVQTLSRFYKLSLNRGGDFISIRDELAHVKAYVEIQNYRFENSIKLGFDVDEELLDLQIIKIIFQPIVENCILHGLLEKLGKSGTIQITGHLVDKEIQIEICDDGIGFINSPALDSQVFNGITANSGGYGLQNIQSRIQLLHGISYGLTISSVPGTGTTVRICLPSQI